MENLFINVLKVSFVCSVIIFLIFLLSPILQKGRSVFWRYLLWITLGIRLVLPFDFSIENPLITIPIFSVIEKENIENYVSPNSLEENVESMILGKNKVSKTEIFTQEELKETKFVTEEIENIKEDVKENINESNKNIQNNSNKSLENYNNTKGNYLFSFLRVVQKLNLDFRLDVKK